MLTKQTLTVLAMIAAALAPLLLAGCGSPMDPNYQGYNVDPLTRAAVVSAILGGGGIGARPSGPVYFAPCTIYAQIAHNC